MAVEKNRKKIVTTGGHRRHALPSHPAPLARLPRPVAGAASRWYKDDVTFVPGLELSRGFFADCVEPLLETGFPGLRYSAALIGHGSEVLGFDTAMSTDHHWGPRAMLFLGADDLERHGRAIGAHLGRTLPSSYRGWSTHFGPPDPDDHGTQLLRPHEDGPVNHRVELFTVEGWFRSYLGLDVNAPMDAAAWLSIPSQKLRSIVSGAVFRDDLCLQSIRERLSWYPRDVELYILGCLWTRIGQEEHLMGRAGHAGDELGSAIIGSRLARDVMRIAFCLERQYPPYPKWFGTAFDRLASAPTLAPLLRRAVASGTWKEREEALASAFEFLVAMQRKAGITDGLSGRTERFWGRPFLVIRGDRVAAAVFDLIADEKLRATARARPIGSIDLASDNTDVLEDPSLQSAFQAISLI